MPKLLEGDRVPGLDYYIIFCLLFVWASVKGKGLVITWVWLKKLRVVGCLSWASFQQWSALSSLPFLPVCSPL